MTNPILNATSGDLPYAFDLHWDVKDLEQVERIAAGKPDCSDADPEDLLALFIDLALEVPACLEKFKLIYIHTDGTWSNEKKEGSQRVQKAW